jgi:hypothetical protein
MRRRIPSLSLLVAATALVACATFGADVQRTTQGPTADEVWMARFVHGYGRLPTFDEQVTWKDSFETRILAFLSRRPEVATSTRASQFRFERRVIVGMNRDEVVALLEQVTSDVATMRTAAGRFWEPIAARAKEMWSYPPGWRLYFDGDRLADVVVAGRSPLD